MSTLFQDSLFGIVGLTFAYIGILDGDPTLMIVGSFALGMPMLLRNIIRPTEPTVPDWDKAIARYMAGEIDDIDLDLEGDYILRGKPRPVPKNRLGPPQKGAGHFSWCTCDKCFTSPRPNYLAYYDTEKDAVMVTAGSPNSKGIVWTNAPKDTSKSTLIHPMDEPWPRQYI